MAVILILEDDDSVRVLTESCLRSHGHKTLSAATVEQALAILESPAALDLLLADLTIHGDPEAGLSLANKAVELRPELKVLYTTGQGVTDGMIALFVKNSAFLPKPYTLDQLTETLREKFNMHAQQ